MTVKTIQSVTQEQLVQGCRKQDRKVQQWIYDRYAPIFLGVCRRYIRNPEDAEDVLIEGFYKIFSRIDQYTGEGNFEGWMRRIMVNESLMCLRKRNELVYHTDDFSHIGGGEEASIEQELAAGEILQLLDRLPDGYRTVFNLYVVEGMKHREIAEALGISVNTSKSQLILAKKRLQEFIERRETPQYES